MTNHDSVGAPGGESASAARVPAVGESRAPVSDNVLVTLLVDLDEALHFAQETQLHLTSTQLREVSPDGRARVWPLAAPGLQLRLAEHAGVATLDLLGPHGLLARWRFTLVGQAAAVRLVRLFEQLRGGGVQPEAADAEEAVDTEL